MNNSNKLVVTIIIPLFNKEKTISKTILSSINQTYKNIEILVIDDGSTDRGSFIVNQINDSRIKLYNKKNGGVSSARNYGIQKASGDFLFFLDADDILKESCIEIFVEASLRYPTIYAFTSNFEISINNTKRKFCACDEEQIIEFPFRELWFRNIFPRTGNIFIHKKCISKVSLFDEDLNRYEDLDFTIRILDNYPIVYLPYSSFIYNTDHVQLSKKKTDIRKEYASKIVLQHNFSYKNMILAEILFNEILRRAKMKDYKAFRCLIKKYFKYCFVFIYTYLLRKSKK